MSDIKERMDIYMREVDPLVMALSAKMNELGFDHAFYVEVAVQLDKSEENFGDVTSRSSIRVNLDSEFVSDKIVLLTGLISSQELCENVCEYLYGTDSLDSANPEVYKPNMN